MASSPIYEINGYEFQFQCNTGRHFGKGVCVNYGPEVMNDSDFIEAFKFALDIFPHANLWELANGHEEVEPDKALRDLVAFAKAKCPIPHVSSTLKRVKTTAPGYVYLLQSPTSAYKIGRTKSPKSRSKTFGVQLPFEVEFIALIKTNDMLRLEAELHQQYAEKRVNGEWFNLSSEDVEYIKSLAGGVE